ncbi:MAG: hypothetical protein PHV02_12705 [Rhodocyclaceae bacterium]|nr:hypothetical protein [Rhodocyclaceae bacterium]
MSFSFAKVEPMPSKPNIFRINPKLSGEDRFTAYWHYILSSYPTTGQSILDQIALSAELPKTRFISAIDHPIGDQKNRPDFEIEGEDYNILFEHKIFSELGEQQLERYLKLASVRAKKTYLAFVSARNHKLEDMILSDPLYIQPRGEAQHFTWQVLGAELKRERYGLVKEFLQYMEMEGLLTMPWAGLGDPFIDSKAENALREVLKEVANDTRKQGCSIRHSSKSIGTEYRKPLTGIHLIYIYASPHFSSEDERLSGRLMYASVWIKHPGGFLQAKLPDAYGSFDGSPQVFVSDEVVQSSWDKDLYRERLYMASLPKILGKSQIEARRNIREFIQLIIEHLENNLGHSVQSLEVI